MRKKLLDKLISVVLVEQMILSILCQGFESCKIFASSGVAGDFTQKENLMEKDYCCEVEELNKYNCEKNGLRYKLGKETATLNACINKKIVKAKIPNYISKCGKQYKVMFIGDNAFCKCISLESIEISSSIKWIGIRAFEDCTKLTSVVFEIPSSLSMIGDYAFHNCEVLESVRIPSRVTITGCFIFKGCRRLTSVVFEDGSNLTSIGDMGFEFCGSLKELKIPRGANYEAKLRDMLPNDAKIIYIDEKLNGRN